VNQFADFSGRKPDSQFLHRFAKQVVDWLDGQRVGPYMSAPLPKKAKNNHASKTQKKKALSQTSNHQILLTPCPLTEREIEMANDTKTPWVDKSLREKEGKQYIEA